MMRFAAVVPLLLVACVHTREIPTAELMRLDGFGNTGVSLSGDESARRYVTLKDVAGEAVAFTKESELRLLLTDGELVKESFRDIQVRDGMFSGTSDRGLPVLVPLENVRSADVSWLSSGGTIAAVLGGSLATLGAAATIGFILFLMFRPISGRPLRLAGKASVARVCDNGDWVASDVAPDVGPLAAGAREELAKAWLADAQAEHASVAAFSRLSTTLLAVGAPPELVVAANRSALEEIDHARRTFALASAYAGRALGPAPLPALLGAPSGTGELPELAVESLVDGCLNEGLAAELAAEAERSTTDAAVRATLKIIARDEAAHRELAWDIVAWCARVDARTHAALESALQGLPRLVRFEDCSYEARGHGRVSAATQRKIFERVRAEVVERAQRLLPSRRAA